MILDAGPLLYLLLHNYDKFTDLDVYNRVDKVAKQEFNEKNSEIFVQRLSGKSLFITPRILAECSNLAESKNIKLGEFIEMNDKFLRKSVSEEYQNKGSILSTQFGLNFGITDCSIAELVNSDNYSVISTDGDFISELGNNGFNAIPLGTYFLEV
ncbi:MAG: hypothetical protein ABEJ83_04150 [Candidatus Nanohaloarchaea archaeon]